MILGGGGGIRGVLRYRARAAALGRSLQKEDQSGGVCLRRLEEMTVRVAEAASSLLSRHGGHYQQKIYYLGAFYAILKKLLFGGKDMDNALSKVQT